MSDSRVMEAIARDPQGRLNDPNIFKEDDPPMLRFARKTIKDPVESEKNGIYVPMDAIFVYVKAYGDIKNEVPYIAEKAVYIPTVEQVVVEKTVPITVIKEDSDGNRKEETKFETKETLEDRATYERETVYPWLDQLKEKYRNGRITQKYLEFCETAFFQWKEKGDIPIDGYPVIEWRMISPAQQEMLLAIGINSVEKAAEMSEDALSAYGMGGRDLKKKAKEFLLAGADQSKSAARILALESQNEKKDEELGRLAQKIAELEELYATQNGGGSSVEETDDDSITGTEDVS